MSDERKGRRSYGRRFESVRTQVSSVGCRGIEVPPVGASRFVNTICTGAPVPKGPARIARRFNAGSGRTEGQVPKGRPNRPLVFSRPFGTGFVCRLIPALKRRAILRCPSGTECRGHGCAKGDLCGLPLAPRPSPLRPRTASNPWSNAPALALVVLLLCPGFVFASTADALREYKHGQYEQALKEYQQLLQRKGGDSRLHFNAGAAAYRNHQLDEAAKQFDDAANATDLRLQGMAYYNRGNTLYYLGEQDPDTSKRGETWKKAVQDFQNSLKLNPQDKDAKFNLEFVKKKIEELKQQQQQSQQKKSDQQQNQDQQQQQQKQGQQSQKQDDQKQQQQQQQQQDQQQQQAQSQQDQQSQQQKQDDQKQQQQAAQSQEQKQQQQQQQQAKQSSGQPNESDENGKDQQAAAIPAGQMTPQQAQQLLDSQKGEEMVLPANPKARLSDPRRPRKDW